MTTSASDTVIRPARPTDADRLSELLDQLGYPSEPDAVARRLSAVLADGDQRVLVIGPAGGRIDGFVGVERRRLLQEDDRAEITGLVVDVALRRGGAGRALVQAAEQWALAQGLTTVVVRSSVARTESHPFYAGVGYERTKTSHIYRKDLSG